MTTPPKVTAAHREAALELWRRSNDPAAGDDFGPELIAEALAAAESRSAPSRADGWVSVEERLPERDVDVLVLGRSGSYYVCHMTIDGRKAGWYPGGWGVGHTTHWRPLPPEPAPPTETTDEG